MISFCVDTFLTARTRTVPTYVWIGSPLQDQALVELIPALPTARTIPTWHDFRAMLKELTRPVFAFTSPDTTADLASLDPPHLGVAIVIAGARAALKTATLDSADLLVPLPPGDRTRARLAMLQKRMALEAQALAMTVDRKEALEAIAHDLKSPTTAIVARAELLQMEVPKGLQDDLGRIVENARAVEDLAGRLLSLARPGASAVPLRPRIVSARNIVEAAVRNTTAGCNARGIATELDLAADLPDLWVDPIAIRRVLSNILDNAVRISPRGASIGVQVVRTGTSLRFRVMDRGPGLAPELLSRIFKRHQSGAGRSGLGLAIAWELVTLHGGVIWAENRPGGGALFTIILPSALHDFTVYRSPHCHIAARPGPDGLDITFHGAFGQEDVTGLRTSLLAATAEAASVRIDLRPCRHLASGALAVLFELFLESDRQACPCRILGVSEEIEAVVQAAGLTDDFRGAHRRGEAPW
jgi:signal transduction histidine kinase/ABC-type transporter Mla MlaB component